MYFQCGRACLRSDGNEVVVSTVYCSSEARVTHLTIFVLVTGERVDSRSVVGWINSRGMAL